MNGPLHLPLASGAEPLTLVFNQPAGLDESWSRVEQREFHDRQASELARQLRITLPGGMLHRLVACLLASCAPDFILPLEKPTVVRCEHKFMRQVFGERCIKCGVGRA